VIRRNHRNGELSLDLLRWGLIPYWCDDPKGGRKVSPGGRLLPR
jgi:putative SOS response-associated peptidase YedK